MSALLDVVGVYKRFGALDVLRGVNLTAHRGECLVVLGASGSGKSTLLRCINLLEPISSGSIAFKGETITGSPTNAHRANANRANANRANANRIRQQIGMVFQSFELFQHLSAVENVVLAPVRVKGEAPQEARAYARHLLAKVHLPDKADALPDELSGGQQQRVAIARALAMRPELLLYDEPTSALDPETVGEVLQVMQELSDEGMTSIVVTHEMGFARRAADRVVFMEHGQIAHSASAADFFGAAVPERVARFLGGIET